MLHLLLTPYNVGHLFNVRGPQCNKERLEHARWSRGAKAARRSQVSLARFVFSPGAPNFGMSSLDTRLPNPLNARPWTFNPNLLHPKP